MAVAACGVACATGSVVYVVVVVEVRCWSGCPWRVRLDAPVSTITIATRVTKNADVSDSGAMVGIATCCRNDVACRPLR